MRLASLVVILLILFIAVCPAKAALGYHIQFREVGGAWQNAPEQFIYGDWPVYPERPAFRIYLERRDANAAREAGKLNHPEYEWQVEAL